LVASEKEEVEVVKVVEKALKMLHLFVMVGMDLHTWHTPTQEVVEGVHNFNV